METITLSKRTAQRIVDTIKDVCGCDINYINKDGIIFASTNSSRIGTFHEIGKKVAQTHETIEIISDSDYLGTQKGINIPFFYHREILAIIGISGNPDDVRQYGLLAQKITSLILKEMEIGSIHYRKKSQLHYLINALIGEENATQEELAYDLKAFNLLPATPTRTIIFRTALETPRSNLSHIEEMIYHFFDQTHEQCYTFNFPNEYLLLLSETHYQRFLPQLRDFAHKMTPLIEIAVGSKTSLLCQHKSYYTAQLALKSMTKGESIVFFDKLDIEILLESVDLQTKKDYLDKTLSSLSKDELSLLETYFSTDMSLKTTAQELFLHKNTVQYKLNQIEKLCGYNPRSFREAVILYVALKLQEST